MYLAVQRASKLPSDEGLAFCYDILNRVSRRCVAPAARCSLGPCAARPAPSAGRAVNGHGGRRGHPARAASATNAGIASQQLTARRPPRSFAVVIQQLPNPLRDAICVFYLVLRGLDTVEDDMAIPDSVKLPALRSFHEKIYQRCVGGVGGGRKAGGAATNLPPTGCAAAAEQQQQRGRDNSAAPRPLTGASR